MKFVYYEPPILVELLKKDHVPSHYEVCSGCVLTHMFPTDCYHDHDDFSSPDAQSDLMCRHCVDTVNLDGEPMPLSADKNLVEKIRELEEILRIAHSEE